VRECHQPSLGEFPLEIPTHGQGEQSTGETNHSILLGILLHINNYHPSQITMWLLRWGGIHWISGEDNFTHNVLMNHTYEYYSTKLEHSEYSHSNTK